MQFFDQNRFVFFVKKLYICAPLSFKHASKFSRGQKHNFCPKNSQKSTKTYYFWTARREVGALETYGHKQTTMGRFERGVHFGAVSLKRGEESSKFPVAIFCYTFFFDYL